MVRDWSQVGNTVQGGTPAAAAPSGQRQITDWSAVSGQKASPWLQPAWETGGRTGTTSNSFNDDFFRRMYDQYDEEQKKTQQNPNYVANLFGRKDFTGIVGWDQDIKRSDPILGKGLQEDRKFRVGDVYDNGRRLGNVYDQNSGLSLKDANAMVAPHIWGDRAADKYKEANGDQEKLKSLILDQGKKQGQDIQAYATRQPYQQSVSRLLKEWEGGIGDEAAIVGAGLVGGAAVGLTFGVPGAIVGGVLGGLGSWMNMDESRDQAARAVASTDIVARREGLDAAIAHGMSVWGAAAGSKLNIFSNLVSGTVDSLWGKWGDNKSEIREAAGSGNVGSTVALGVAGFVDGLLTTGSKVGQTAYMATTLGSATATAYNKAAHQGEWDEVTGSFHKYENWNQGLAAAGSSLIDIGQGLLPGLLSRSAKLGQGGTQHVDPAALKIGETGKVRMMDRAFDVTRTSETTWKADKEYVADGLIAWLAPSTISTRLTTRAAASLEALGKNSNKVGPNELYQAAVKIEQASVPWKLAMVNGFGESLEEVTQTYLNAQATGWEAEPNEYLQAAVQGFAMGAGMSFGSRVGNVSQDLRMFHRARVIQETAGQPLSKDEWSKLSRPEKVRLSTPSLSLERQLRRDMADTMADFTQVVVTSRTALTAQEDAVKKSLKDSPVELDGGSIEQMFAALQLNDVYIPNHHARLSARATVKVLEDRLKGLQYALKGKTQTREPLDRPRTEAALKALSTLLDEQIRPAFREYNKSKDERHLQTMNDALQAAWDGTPDQRQAVELVFSRGPYENPGSFQMLLPQVDVFWTRKGRDGNLGVSQALEKLLSYDTDGDKLKHMARHIVPDDKTRLTMRLGLGEWASAEGTKEAAADAPYGGSGFLNLVKREYEKDTLEAMQRVLGANNPKDVQLLKDTATELGDILKRGLQDAVPHVYIDRFVKTLQQNPAGGKEEFYRALAQHSGTLLDRGLQGSELFPPETRVSLWIETRIQQSLERWRDGMALRQELEVLKPASKMPQPRPLPTDLKSSVEVTATTPGETAAQRAGTSDPMRIYGRFAYNFLNATMESAEGASHPSQIVQALTEWYTVQSRLRAQSQVATIRQGGHETVREARRDLESLAAAFFLDAPNPPASKAERLARVASMDVWDVSEKQLHSPGWDMSKHMKPGTTVAQLLLKNAAERVTDSTPDVFGTPNASIAYVGIQRARAVQLLLGDIAPADVMSEDAAKAFGPTVNLDLAIRNYQQLQSRKARQAWREQMKNLAAAEQDSMTKWFVDTIREAADAELAHGDPSTGKAVGRLADEDRKFHSESLVKGIEGMHQIVRQLGLRGRELTADQLLRRLETDTRTWEYLLSMMPPDMRGSVIRKTEGGPNEVTVPKFLLDMLMETDAEKAAMIYWNALFQWDLVWHGDDSAPGNSWVALWQSLDDDARDAFDDLRLTSGDVQSFVNEVNKRFGENRAPLMAWRTDTTMFDPASTHGGWQWSAPSAERRQAIKDANEYFVSRADTIEASEDLLQRNALYAKKLQDDLKNRHTMDQAKTRLLSLSNRLKQGKLFSRVGIGPSAMHQFAEFAYRGFEANSANKGISNASIQPVGDADIRRNAWLFGNPMEQELAAATVVNAANLRQNPQLLTQRLRIQTATGLEIDWDPEAPGFEERFLEFFLADDGAYQGLMMDLVNPIVFEEVGTGKVTQRYLLPKSLEAIIEGTFYKDILEGEGGRSKQENDELLLSFVNSLTPDNNVLRLVGQLVVARGTKEFAGSELSTTEWSKAVTDVASLLRDMAGMSAEAVESAKDQQQAAAILAYLAQTSDKTAGADFIALQALIENAKLQAESAELDYQVSPTPETNAKYIEAVQHWVELTARAESKSISEIMLRAFEIKWNTPAELVTKQAVRDYLQTYGPDLRASTTGEDADLLGDLAAAPVVNEFSVFGNEGQDRAAWSHLAKIVSAHNTFRNNGYRAAAFFSAPQTKDLAYFDPTFSYLGQTLLDPENKILEALHSLATAAGPTAIPKSPTPVDLIERITDLLTKGLTWTPELVVKHLSADRYLGSAGAPQQVAVGGNVPQDQLAASLSARRTFEAPEPSKARSYTLDVADLAAARYTPYERTMNDDAWVMLNGAFVRETPVLVVKAADGTELARHELALAVQPAYSAPAYGVTSLRALSDAAAVRLVPYADDVTATVELGFFHPEDKPAEKQWANSIYYDGVLGAADQAAGLYEALNLENDGIAQRMQRQALDAIKGSPAIYNPRHERSFDSKDPAQLAAVIHDITAKLMASPLGKGYYLPTNAYRAVYRVVRDRLTVTGDGQVLSTEQVLTGSPLPAEAQVSALSRESLETLRGGVFSGHPGRLEHAPLNGGEAEPWTGVFTPEQLQRLPELGQTVSDVTKVGNALRASGLTSMERVDVYTRKAAPSRARSLRQTPFDKYRGLREGVKEARREQKSVQHVKDSTDRILNLTKAKLKADGRIAGKTKDLLKLSMGAVTTDRTVEEISTARTLQDVQSYLAFSGGRAFLLDPRKTDRSGNDGYLSSIHQGSETPAGRISPVDDLVTVDLDAFEGTHRDAEWQQQVRDELLAARELGLGVILTGTDSGARLDADTFMFEGGLPYTRSKSGLPLYFPKERDGFQRTRAAREASLTETTRHDLTNYVIGALVENGEITAGGEGVGADPRGKWFGREQSWFGNIYPTNGVKHYGAPGTQEAGIVAERTLRDLLLPENQDYLVEQYFLGGGKPDTEKNRLKQKKRLLKLTQKALDTLDITTGLPKRGTRVEPGDFQVTMTADLSAVALTRWGYDTVDVDVEAQDANSLQNGTRTGFTAKDSVRLYAARQLSSLKATVHGGVLDDIKPDPVWGWRLILKEEREIFTAKMIESGQKTRGVLLKEKHRPTTSLLGDLFPSWWNLADAARKKGRKTVTNARQAIFTFGWDATRPLANAIGLTDKDNNLQSWTRDEWAALKPEQRDDITARVRDHLENWRLHLAPSERISDRVELADAILKNDYKARRVARLAEKRPNLSSAALQAMAQAYNDPQSKESVEIGYLEAVKTFLRGDGTSVSQVLGAPGVEQPGVERPESVEMPSALTEFIDIDEGLRKYVQTDMNSRMANNEYEKGKLKVGWWIRDDWTLFQRNRNGIARIVTLVIDRSDTTGTDDSEAIVEANRASTSDNGSNQAATIGWSFGLDLGHSVRDKKWEERLQRNGTDYLTAQRGRGTARRGAVVELSLEEQQARSEQTYRAIGYMQPFTRERWGDDPTTLQEINSLYKQVAKVLGWNESGKYNRHIDSMLRVYYRAWKNPEMPGVDEISGAAALDALNSILTELQAGRWPFNEAQLPLIHADVVVAIADADRWNPDNEKVTVDRRHELLTSAFESMMYSATRLPASANPELMAIIRSYDKYLADGYWVPSAFPESIKALLDPRGNFFVSTTDPIHQKTLEEGDPYKRADSSIFRNSATSQLSTGTKTSTMKRRYSITERGRHTRGTVSQTTAQVRQSGREYLDEVRLSTQWWRNAHALRTIMPQLSPLLWVWNPVDASARLLPAAGASLLSGSATGWVGQQVTARVRDLAQVSQAVVDENPATKGAKVMQGFIDAFGIQKPYVDDDAAFVLPTVLKELTLSRKFRGMIGAETIHRPDDPLLTVGDRARQKAVDWASKMQDITHGMLRPWQAQMYVEGILEHERVHNPQITAAQILRNLHDNPLYFKEQVDTGAHRQAVNRVQNVTGARQTTLGAWIDNILMPMAKSANPVFNFAGNLTLLMAKFRNFAISSGINMTGAQGLDAAAAIVSQMIAFKRSQHTGNTPTDYLTRVLEATDISDLFIRSGLSHTGLLMAALAANSLGLTGDDEEERKRKRIQQLQGLGVLYDPLDVANDFRNRDAVFLDKLGVLSALFEVPAGDGQPQRSPAQLHWTLNFFVAPALGLTEFLQTGEFYDLAHGFESAIGNMPLFNPAYFEEAMNTSAMLYRESLNEDSADPGGLANGVGFLLKTVGVLEHALLENSFINEIVAAQDPWARNPWGMPRLSDDGSIKRDAYGLPDLTDTKNPEIGPDGTVIDRRETRTYEEGLLRAFTQNNQTAAFLATLFTGSFNKPGSYMRGDQTVSQKVLLKSGISNDDAETLIMSFWDPDNQKETLSREGAERLVDSMHAGTIRASDPAFQNIFLTYDQRSQISESIQTKLYLEGVQTLGLSDYDAKQRMWNYWYGKPGSNATPLSDVVWSRGKFAAENGIPWNPTSTYRQLSTTWVMGPDGKQWATGIARNTLLGAGLIPGLIPYDGAAGAGQRGNLGVDEMLNSTDAMAGMGGINLGRRGMTRVDETSQIPDEKDILAAIKQSTQNVMDAIKDLGSDLYRNNKGGSGGGFRYGGGGGGGGRGGGGGGYGGNQALLPFLNAMRSENTDNIPQMYINTINPRRADIRRERFSAERGRLNQWQ